MQLFISDLNLVDGHGLTIISDQHKVIALVTLHSVYLTCLLTSSSFYVGYCRSSKGSDAIS